MVLSSELRLKILSAPSSVRWIWPRSPSYLYSHVNVWSAKRSSTSLMPLVGCASMGFTGMPGRRKHLVGSSSSGARSSSGMLRS